MLGPNPKPRTSKMTSVDLFKKHNEAMAKVQGKIPAGFEAFKERTEEQQFKNLLAPIKQAVITLFDTDEHDFSAEEENKAKKHLSDAIDTAEKALKAHHEESKQLIQKQKAAASTDAEKKSLEDLLQNLETAHQEDLKNFKEYGQRLTKEADRHISAYGERTRAALEAANYLHPEFGGRKGLNRSTRTLSFGVGEAYDIHADKAANLVYGKGTYVLNNSFKLAFVEDLFGMLTGKANYRHSMAKITIEDKKCSIEYPWYAGLFGGEKEIFEKSLGMLRASGHKSIDLRPGSSQIDNPALMAYHAARMGLTVKYSETDAAVKRAVEKGQKAFEEERAEARATGKSTSSAKLATYQAISHEVVSLGSQLKTLHISVQKNTTLLGQCLDANSASLFNDYNNLVTELKTADPECPLLELAGPPQDRLHQELRTRVQALEDYVNDRQMQLSRKADKIDATDSNKLNLEHAQKIRSFATALDANWHGMPLDVEEEQRSEFFMKARPNQQAALLKQGLASTDPKRKTEAGEWIKKLCEGTESDPDPAIIKKSLKDEEKNRLVNLLKETAKGTDPEIQKVNTAFLNELIKNPEDWKAVLDVMISDPSPEAPNAKKAMFTHLSADPARVKEITKLGTPVLVPLIENVFNSPDYEAKAKVNIIKGCELNQQLEILAGVNYGHLKGILDSLSFSERQDWCSGIMRNNKANDGLCKKIGEYLATPAASQTAAGTPPPSKIFTEAQKRAAQTFDPPLSTRVLKSILASEDSELTDDMARERCLEILEAKRKALAPLGDPLTDQEEELLKFIQGGGDDFNKVDAMNKIFGVNPAAGPGTGLTI